MSNLERQRKFRASHPGYFNKYNGRQKMIAKHAKARVKAMMIAIAEAERAEAEKAQAAMAIRPMPLMLPAPAEVATIPGMNAIPATVSPAFSQPATVPA